MITTNVESAISTPPLVPIDDADLNTEQDWLTLYSQTKFIFRNVDSRPLPNPFAIITAYNPKSQITDESQNRDLNNALESELSQVRYEPIIGASPDLTHQEPSFIVQLSKPAAIGLARKYNQNAIFWVERDELHVVPVLMDADEVTVGTFRARVVDNK